MNRNKQKVAQLFLIAAFGLLLPLAAVAQNLPVYGPTEATVGNPETFTFYSEYDGNPGDAWSTSANDAATWTTQYYPYYATSATITWNRAGVFEVNGYLGIAYGYLTVTVHPAPPTVTPASGCDTDGVTISATAGNGGNTVRWYNTPTGGTPFFTPNGPSGSVTVHDVANVTCYVSTYNSSLGLESLTRVPVTATISTRPSATPAVSGNVVIGPGMPITLHASTASNQAYTYKWYNSSGALLYTGQDYPATAPASTTAAFVYAKYNNAGCEGPANSVTVTVYPKPVITGTAIAQSQPATLTASVGFDTYAWYKQGVSGPIPGANAITYSTAEPGFYLVRVTKGGVSGDSDWFNLTSQFGNQNENQIVVNDIQVSGVTAATAVEGLSNKENIQMVQYFDGLGRTKQTVATQASPLGKDIVQPVVYDAQGREFRKYLPIVPGSNNGWYKPGIIDAAGNYTGDAAINVYNNGTADMIADDTVTYAETRFEPSPLNRVFKQGAVGKAWQPEAGGTYTTASLTDHSIKKAYVFNVAGEVMWLKYDMQTSTVGLGDSNYYLANVLQANKTKDEHNHEVVEYVDREGRVVMKKAETMVDGVTAYAETYYVYDDFGRQVMVIPPEASEKMKQLLIN